MKPRIGGVPYGVGAPLLAGLASDPAVTLTQAPPTALIAALRRGELDCALVSSIEAIRAPGYAIVPGLGIASREEVRSVRAFRRPGRTIRRVGLDRSSATSVTLLRLLLEVGPRAADAAPRGDLEYDEVAPTTAPAALPHDLVLMIGDHGLNAAAGDLEVWDLAREWRNWTGLPFVFAVWLVRPGADPDAIAPALRAARRRGRALGPVDGTHGAVHYDLDDRDLRGLQHFWQLARQAGFGRADADPALVNAALEGDNG